MFFPATCVSQRGSVVKLAFPLPHHSVTKIKALWCVTPIGFVTRRETLFIRDPLSDCHCGLWLCVSKEVISSASFLISNPVSPCADTWFVINECLSLGAVRERVGTVTPVMTPGCLLKDSLQQNSWINRVTLWREMDGEASGVTESIPFFFHPSPFFASCGHCYAWEHVTCSMNWRKSVLKPWIYTEHLDICCSSHINYLKQSNFLQCNQDRLPAWQEHVGPLTDCWRSPDLCEKDVLIRKCLGHKIIFCCSLLCKGKRARVCGVGDVRSPVTHLTP